MSGKRNHANACKQYKSDGRDSINRKRRMARHLRSNPGDKQAFTLLIAEFGAATQKPVPNHKGRRVLKRQKLAA